MRTKDSAHMRTRRPPGGNGESTADSVRSVEAELEHLRAQRDELDRRRVDINAQRVVLEEKIRTAETFLRVRRGESSAIRKRRRGPTNRQTILGLLKSAEPEGLLVTELVDQLIAAGHPLANAANPLKATSNELSRMRKNELVRKDRLSRRYRINGDRSVPARPMR